MNTKLLYQPFDKIEADAVAVVLFENEAAPSELKFASAWLDELHASGEFSGKADEMAVLHQTQGVGAKRMGGGGGGKGGALDLRKTAAAGTPAPERKGVGEPAWGVQGGGPGSGR